MAVVVSLGLVGCGAKPNALSISLKEEKRRSRRQIRFLRNVWWFQCLRVCSIDRYREGNVEQLLPEKLFETTFLRIHGSTFVVPWPGKLGRRKAEVSPTNSFFEKRLVLSLPPRVVN